MVMLIPIINLKDKTTYGILKVVPTKFVVVRIQDLLSNDSLKPNKTFHNIVNFGGLHNYLDYSNPIILSTIMKDGIIAHFDAEKYAMLIDSTEPDAYTTVDGETYHNEYKKSSIEIERMLWETRSLIKLCPKQMPIGLVKGCNANQIEYHIAALKSIGVEAFVFHVGDFLRHGDSNMITLAKNFSYRIRRHAKFLMLYGMGSQKRLLEFSFADAYITFNHFVTAINGMKFVGTNKVKYTGSYRPEIMIDNFIQMHKNLAHSINGQTRLNGDKKWVAELEATVRAM